MSLRLSVALGAGLAVVIAAGACKEEPVSSQSLNAPAPAATPAGHPAPQGSMAMNQPAQPEAETVVVAQGSIAVDDRLVGKVPGQAVVFITGRAPPVPENPQGPAILVKKIPAAQFPMAFTLTSRDLMMPGMRIPDEVSVQVRLDQDGDAISQSPGDLKGIAAGVKPGSTDVRIVLSEVVTEFKPGQRIDQ